MTKQTLKPQPQITRVRIAEVCASNAKIETVRISEHGEYVNNVWTPTPTKPRQPKQPTPEQIAEANKALDAVNEKFGMNF